MKKLLLTLSTLAVASLNADIIRIEGGAGAWVQEPSGTISEKTFTQSELDLVNTLGYSSNTNYYAWAYFKHFIPLVPNVRLETAQSEFSGNAEAEFSWDGIDYKAGVSNTLNIKQYDGVLYYNILDNTLWTTIDLGIDIKYFNTESSVEGISIDSSDFAVGLLYARGRVEIPATGLAAEIAVKGLSYSSLDVYDAYAKIDYKFDFPVVQPGIELGYRYESIVINSNEVVPVDSKIDITISGVYAGVNLAF